MIMLR